MTLGRQFVVFIVALGLSLGTGCKRKKAQLAVNMQAPTLAVPVPDQIPEIAPPPEPPPAKQEETVEEQAPKKTPQKHRSSKKPATPPATAPPAANQGSTTVAVNRPPANSAIEAATDTAIAADVTGKQLVEQKQTTSELLDSAEKNLKGLTGLSHDEEAIVTQIKSYIAQSRKATSDGDFERAYNLAMKAHLLTDALVKK